MGSGRVAVSKNWEKRRGSEWFEKLGKLGRGNGDEKEFVF